MTQKPSIRHAITLACAVLTTYAHQAHAQAKDDGTYYDTATGLTWMRCMVGQTWANGTCTGAATTHTFDQATAMTGKVSFAGENDWRVPNIRELLSLVNYTNVSGPFNKTIFPSNGGSGAWSSSRGDAYGSVFNLETSVGMFGLSSIGDTQIRSVFWVRNGQSPFPIETSPTDINCLLNWAESRFANLFSPANSATQTAGTISYRAYAGNVFLGVDSGSDAVLGGAFGNAPVNVGKMADYLPTARAASCK
jgi:hypothetical protein